LIKFILDYADKGGDVNDSGYLSALGSLWTLASLGNSALAPVNQFNEAVSRGIGVSRDLDRPFMKIQNACLRIADVSGILDGWKAGLRTLESKHFNNGFLDGLAPPDI
jgi:hypothetical protein